VLPRVRARTKTANGTGNFLGGGGWVGKGKEWGVLHLPPARGRPAVALELVLGVVLGEGVGGNAVGGWEDATPPLSLTGEEVLVEVHVVAEEGAGEDDEEGVGELDRRVEGHELEEAEGGREGAAALAEEEGHGLDGGVGHGVGEGGGDGGLHLREGDADVGGAEGEGVVGAVSDHEHVQPGLLEHLDDVRLGVGAHARKDGAVEDDPGEEVPSRGGEVARVEGRKGRTGEGEAVRLLARRRSAGRRLPVVDGEEGDGVEEGRVVVRVAEGDDGVGRGGGVGRAAGLARGGGDHVPDKDPVPVLDEAALARDADGGDGVVARDHRHPDVSLAAEALDGGAGLGLEGVVEDNEAGKLEARLGLGADGGGVGAGEGEGALVGLARGAEDAVAALGEGGEGGAKVGRERGGEGEGGDALRRALDVARHGAVGLLHEHTHALQSRLELEDADDVDGGGGGGRGPRGGGGDRARDGDAGREGRRGVEAGDEVCAPGRVGLINGRARRAKGLELERVSGELAVDVGEGVTGGEEAGDCARQGAAGLDSGEEGAVGRGEDDGELQGVRGERAGLVEADGVDLAGEVDLGRGDAEELLPAQRGDGVDDPDGEGEGERGRHDDGDHVAAALHNGADLVARAVAGGAVVIDAVEAHLPGVDSEAAHGGEEEEADKVDGLGQEAEGDGAGVEDGEDEAALDALPARADDGGEDGLALGAAELRDLRAPKEGVAGLCGVDEGGVRRQLRDDGCLARQHRLRHGRLPLDEDDVAGEAHPVLDLDDVARREAGGVDRGGGAAADDGDGPRVVGEAAHLLEIPLDVVVVDEGRAEGGREDEDGVAVVGLRAPHLGFGKGGGGGWGRGALVQ
jgi:hypothetical protein